MGAQEGRQTPHFLVLHATMPNPEMLFTAKAPCRWTRVIIVGMTGLRIFFALFYTANRSGVYFGPHRALSVGWMVGWKLHVCPPKRQTPAFTCHRSYRLTSFYALLKTLLTSLMLWPFRALFVSISLLQQVAIQSSSFVINRHGQRVFHSLSFLKGSLIWNQPYSYTWLITVMPV